MDGEYYECGWIRIFSLEIQEEFDLENQEEFDLEINRTKKSLKKDLFKTLS